MNRVALALAAALLVSALVLVHSAHDSRRLYSALDRAQTLQRALEADYRRLDAERQAASTHQRVERLAREKLSMRGATPAITQYVSDPAAADAAATARAPMHTAALDEVPR